MSKFYKHKKQFFKKIIKMNKIKETTPNNDLSSNNSDNLLSLTKMISDRLKDYNDSLEYFIFNDLPDQQNKALEDIKQLKSFLHSINQSISKKLENHHLQLLLPILPQPITPEYIYGYSYEKRTQKFNYLITKIIKQKIGLEKKLKNYINSIKAEKLSKVEFIKKKEQINNYFKEISTQKNNFDKMINLLKKEYKSKWKPAPLYKEIDESVESNKNQQEKKEESENTNINKDVNENTIKITFGKTDYVKNRILFLIQRISGLSYVEKFDQKEKGDWTHTIEWKMEKKEFKEIHERVFRFDIYEKKIFGFQTKYKGSCEVELKDLKEKNMFKGAFKIDLVTKRFEPTIEIEFKIRKCVGSENNNKDKDLNNGENQLFKIIKFFPAFKEENIEESEESNDEEDEDEISKSVCNTNINIKINKVNVNDDKIEKDSKKN